MAVTGRSLACGKAVASPLDNPAATATRYLCSKMAVFTAAGGSNFVENLRRLRRCHGSGSPQLQRRGTVARARGLRESTAPARCIIPRQQRGDFRAATKLLTTWSRSSRLCGATPTAAPKRGKARQRDSSSGDYGNRGGNQVPICHSSSGMGSFAAAAIRGQDVASIHDDGEEASFHSGIFSVGGG